MIQKNNIYIQYIGRMYRKSIQKVYIEIVYEKNIYRIEKLYTKAIQ